jgi:hypothetical protein
VIDFRYHLVSLVSVFLALAVGIVLGAGPLRAPIGTRLAAEVQSLRQDRATLRTQLATEEAAVKNRNDFITEVAPELTGRRLAGQSVVLIRLPGVEDAVLEPLVDSLATSGATVTGRVDITPDWVAPDRQAFRDQLATRLQGSVPGGIAGTVSDQQLAGLLARSVVAGAPPGAGRADAVARTVLAGLSTGDLVSVDGDLEGLADMALILVPGLPEPTDGQAVEPTPSEATVNAYVRLAAALDAGSSGAVVTGPASSATGGGLVAAVRGDEAAARAVSTVDTGGTPMGDVTSILALSEQVSGGAGQYGFGDGASAPLPASPPAAAGAQP